ncbi:MAG TPA: MFS transporter [Symbiobacteriaceae bacterium]|nr:MFS transporter [Symbiobacteriaceae bacterium]
MTYQAPPNGFRTFLIVWASQSVSVFGNALTGFAMNIWLVMSVYPLPEQKAQLAWALAVWGLSASVPAVVATPLAGALADRLDRRRLMLWMDLASAVQMAAIALLMAFGLFNIWLMIVFNVLTTVTGTVHASAFDTAYAMLVPDEQLPRANGMMQTMWSLSGLLSPAVAAAIIALPALARQGRVPIHALAQVKEGAALAIGIDAVTFFLAAAVLAFVSIPRPRRTEATPTDGRKGSIWADVSFGATYIWRRRPLLWLLCTFAVVNLCLPFGVLLPLIVKARTAAAGTGYETGLALVNTLFALGGLAGGAVVSLFGGARRRRVVVLLLSMIAGSVAQIALGLVPSLYGVAACAFFFDAMGPVANAHSQAIWQSQVPRELQGRVFAIRRVIAQALGPLGTVLAGLLAGLMDPGYALALLGAVIIVVSAAQFFNPAIMRVEDTEYLNRLAAGG